MTYKPKKKLFICTAICLLLTAFWIIGVHSFNREVSKIKEPPRIVKNDNIGEWVSFGNNYWGNTYLAGYSIRITDVRIIDSEAYAEELFGADYKDKIETDDITKVCEISATLKNTDNTDTGVDFLSTFLTGTDFYAGLWLDCFNTVNSLEQDTLGNIRLRTNSEYELKIPYAFTEVLYREKSGRTLDSEPMWLALTGYPEHVWAKVQ